MVATWPVVEPRICDTLVRRCTSKPPSHPDDDDDDDDDCDECDSGDM